MIERWRELGEWLRPRVGATGRVEASGLGGPAAIGYSAETTVFRVTYDGARGRVERRLVLRSEVPDPAIYPLQAPGIDVDIEIQHRVMVSIARSSNVPVAPILGYEPDPAVIGTPFFVMDFVEGDVPAVQPPYSASGFFADARPEQRSRMISNGLEVLAEIHRIDWQKARLQWLLPSGEQPTLARQLTIWERCGRKALGGRRHEAMETAAELLHRQLPKGSEPCLCWGDARPGNIIWRDWKYVSVTDWEAAAIAPPESDLGWWLMFDRTMHEGAGLARLPGDSRREEQLAIYERAAGRRVEDLRLHEIFAAYRYCVIVVQIANRLVKRGILPAENQFWCDNPIVSTLRDLLSS
jgi:aminoglycoside phosphotransferase (APT) family kinase protein